MDVAELVLQAIAGIATSVGVIISLYQIHGEKKVRLKEEKRCQSTRISFWYEEMGDRADRPIDGRYAWKAVLLRNASESPCTTWSLLVWESAARGQTQKAKTMAMTIPAVPVLAFFLPERGMHGFQHMGRVCTYGQRRRQLSLMQTGDHGYGEAMASWKR